MCPCSPQRSSLALLADEQQQNHLVSTSDKQPGILLLSPLVNYYYFYCDVKHPIFPMGEITTQVVPCRARRRADCPGLVCSFETTSRSWWPQISLKHLQLHSNTSLGCFSLNTVVMLLPFKCDLLWIISILPLLLPALLMLNQWHFSQDAYIWCFTDDCMWPSHFNYFCCV